MGILPILDFIARCKSHAAHGILDSALKKCERVAHLVSLLVSGMGSTQRHGPPGGFARHLRNSPRLQRKFDQKVLEELSGVVGALLSAADVHNPQWKARNLSFAMERFDALVEPLKKMLMMLRVLLLVIADEASDLRGHKSWATDIMKEVLNYKALVSLALFVEAYMVGKDFVHGFDRKQSGPYSCVARVKPACDAFLRRLDQLFSGAAPLALSKDYTQGVTYHVLCVLKRGLFVQGGSGCVPAAVAWPGSWAERHEPLVEVRHFIKWIRVFIKAAFPHQELQQAFAPFDLESWTGMDRPDAIRQHLVPIAQARKVDVDKVVHHFLAVKPLADAIRQSGVTNVDEYWSRALLERNAATKHPELAVIARPMMSQVVGTMELEGDFSVIQDAQAPRRNLTAKTTRAQCKIRLDCDPPDKLTKEYVSKVISKYIEMYGGRDATKTEERRAKAAVPFLDRRAGVPRPERRGGMAQWERERKQQLASLLNSREHGHQRDSLLGTQAAPSCIDKKEAELWTREKTLEKTKVEKRGQALASRLIADRLPRGNPQRKKLYEKEVDKQDAICADRAQARVTTYEMEAAAGRFEVPTVVFGAALRDGSRARRHIERLGGNCTTREEKAIEKAASHVYVQCLESALRGAVTREIMLARVLGAALVCENWVASADKHRRFPKAPLRYFGLREHREVVLKTSFGMEHADMAHILGRALDKPGCRWVRRASSAAVKTASRGIILVGKSKKPEELAKRKREALASAARRRSIASGSSGAPPVAKRQRLHGSSIWDFDDLWYHLGGGGVPPAASK